MAKATKPVIIQPPKQRDHDPLTRSLTDENGEVIPSATDNDPENITPPEEDLETTPPYEPPVDGEGP